MATDDPVLEMVEIIQAGDQYPEVYAGMIRTYYEAIDGDETQKMALSLAKNHIRMFGIHKQPGAGNNIRLLPQFKVIDGTTWIPTHDEFGTSFRCDVCGHNEFYVSQVPLPCEHNPEPYEAEMQAKKKAED